jgi:AcrR family transcriptional regulator
MAAKAPDRRVLRTRKLLQDALMSLVLEKDYEAVTVQDIIDRANVGRSTFYDHFLDKQQLLLSGLDQLHSFLAEQQQTVAAVPGERGLRFSLPMFEHACGYRQVYRSLVGKRSGAVVKKRIEQMLADVVRDELAALAPHDASTPIPLELVVQYIVSAFMGLLSWWADHDPPGSAAEMDRIFQQVTMPGVLAGLGLMEERGESDGLFATV